MKTASPYARTLLAMSLAPFLLAACGGGDDDNGPAPLPAGLADHTVYTLTNGLTGNEVIAFRRADDGKLTRIGAYATGGNGTGAVEVSPATPNDGVDVLASQGAIQMSPDKQTLVAVNAASATVTSFHIDRDGLLTRVSVVPAGGLQPNALAIKDTLVYVSNVGAASNEFASNINGFRLGADSSLTAIPNATRGLSTPNAQPTRVTFNAKGNVLAVSELTSQHVSVFPVNTDGTLGTAVVSTSAGGGPFGSSFLSNGTFLLTEAMTNTVTSYKLGTDNMLTPISALVPTGQKATCWTIVTPDEKLLYVSNSATGNLTSYRIAADGSVSVLQEVASTLEGDKSGVVDGAASEDGRFIYALNSGLGSITALRIEADGSLTKVQTITGEGLPLLGGEGLVAR